MTTNTASTEHDKSHCLGILFLPQGSLRAEWGDGGMKWEIGGYMRTGSHEELDHAQWYANFLSGPLYYSCSPADGYPGLALAAYVAKELGGRWEPYELDPRLLTDEVIMPGTEAATTENQDEEEFEEESIQVRAAIMADVIARLMDLDPANVQWFLDLVAAEGVTSNYFCPTGKGGGVDPTCGKGKSGVPSAPALAPSSPSSGGVAAAGVRTNKKEGDKAEKDLRAFLTTLKGRKATAEEAARISDYLSKMTTGQMVSLRKEFNVQGHPYRDKAIANITKGLVDKMQKEQAGPNPQPKPTLPPPPPPPVQPKPQPKAEPQPQPTPQPPVQVKGPLPHPELDPNRPGITVGKRIDAYGMTHDEATKLHEQVKAHNTDWFKPGKVGVSTKTLDAMVKKGDLEKTEAGGETFYRPSPNGKFYIQQATLVTSPGPTIFNTPKSVKELNTLVQRYRLLSNEEQLQVMQHYGVAPSSSGLSIHGESLRMQVKQKIEQNLNGTQTIGEQLKNSPHNAVQQKIAALVDNAANAGRTQQVEVAKKLSDLMVREGKLMIEETKLQRERINTRAKSDERKEVDRKLREVREQLSTIGQERVATTNQALFSADAIKREAHRLIHEELNKYGPTHKVDSGNLPEGSQLSGYTNRQVVMGREWLDGKIVQRPGDPPLEKVSKVEPPPPGERSNYHPHDGKDRRRIRLSDTASSGTVVHEFGHHVDETIPGALAASLKFLDHRVGNETPVKMKDVVPGSNYKDNEYGRKDKFEEVHDGDKNRAYYTGKDYHGRYTEIVSMGMEKMYDDPAGFAKKDPEYFNFIMGVMSGEHRRKTLPEE